MAAAIAEISKKAAWITMAQAKVQGQIQIITKSTI